MATRQATGTFSDGVATKRLVNISPSAARTTSYSAMSQTAHRMQSQKILKLKEDNQRLKDELEMETRQAKQANNMSASATIAKLQEDGDAYMARIAIESQRLDQINAEMSAVQVEIMEQRKRMGGVNAFKQRNQDLQRKIRRLENKLDKARVKFNQAMSANVKLRKDIDGLRRERSVFEAICKTLNNDVQRRQHEAMRIREQTAMLNEGTLQAHEQMRKLKQEADLQQAKFEERWLEMRARIEEDRRNAMAGVALTQTTTELLTFKHDQTENKQKIHQINELIRKHTEDAERSESKVKGYETSIADILRHTKQTDIDELVRVFVEAEDASFTMFNRVNELTGHVEKLEESIEGLKEEIRKYDDDNTSLTYPNGTNKTVTSTALVVSSGANNDPSLSSGSPGSTTTTISNTNAVRKKLLVELDGQLSQVVQEGQTYEQRYERAQQTMNRLKSDIANLFNKIGCSSVIAPELFKMGGGGVGVTDTNILSYLGLIETKTNELVNMYISSKTKGLGNKDSHSGNANKRRMDGSGSGMSSSGMLHQHPALGGDIYDDMKKGVHGDDGDDGDDRGLHDDY